MCPQIFRRERPVYPPQVEWLRKQAALSELKVNPYFYELIGLVNGWIKKKFTSPLPTSVLMLNLSTGEFATDGDGKIIYYPFAEEKKIFFQERRSYSGMKLEKGFCDYVRKNVNTTVTILDWSVLLYESYHLLQQTLDRVTELEARLEREFCRKSSPVRKEVPDEWEAFS